MVKEDEPHFTKCHHIKGQTPYFSEPLGEVNMAVSHTGN